MKTSLSILTFALVAAFAVHGPATAQVAGASITTEVNVVESAQVAMGWSVKKTLLGKIIYNESGQKVGKVQDIIIAPDKSVSYIIVGAGGFIGMGRHDVAIPVTQIRGEAGQLVMAGATMDLIKAMPQFEYVNDNVGRDEFVIAADKDITRGKAKLAQLVKNAAGASADAKAKIDLDIVSLQRDVQSAQDKLSELNQAGVKHWREYEASVNATTARLRASIDKSAN